MTDDARDFGECLAEVRDALNEELPVRVQPCRVFLGAAVEVLCVFVMRALRLPFQSVVTTRPDPDGLLKPMMRQFDVLKDRRATMMQMEQTQELLHLEMHRRVRHIEREMALWHHAISSGLYSGTLVFTLFTVSILMCLATDRGEWVARLVVSFALLQATCVLISLRGWLCTRHSN